MKKVTIFVWFVILIGLATNCYSQTATPGPACRYMCFGSCDNIYQTYYGQNNNMPAYVFNGANGGFAQYNCSNYILSPSLGSCYVYDGIRYSPGYAINFIKIADCDIDGTAWVLLVAAAGYGIHHIRRMRNA